MALISASEYLKLRKREQAGEAIFGDVHHCVVCSIALHESETGCREMGDGTFRCSDCYFDKAEELAIYPILPPRLRRRA